MSEIRTNIVNSEDGTAAVHFPKGQVVTGITTATTFAGAGTNLTGLPAGQLTGALPALNAAALTALNASNIASGIVTAARLGGGTANASTFLNGNGQYIEAGGGKLLKWDYAVCEGAKTTTANGSPGDKSKGVELFTKDFACSSSTSTVIIMTNPLNFYESTNGGDNFFLSAWQGTTLISSVSGTPRYHVFESALNAGCLGYFGRHQPGGTSSITYSIRGGMTGSNATTNIQNSNNQQSNQNTRSHMFLFEVEAN